MGVVTEKLDTIADSLEAKGLIQGAEAVDVLSNTFEKRALMEREAGFKEVVQKVKEAAIRYILHALARSQTVQRVAGNIANEMKREYQEKAAKGQRPSINDVRDDVAKERKKVMPEIVEAMVQAGESATGKKAPGPMRRLMKVFIMKAIPKSVFGFIDNFIMVIAGQQIDASIAATFGLAAMASAGLGNTLSDAVGEAFQEPIDALLGKLGLGEIELQNTKGEKIMGAMGGVFGIIAGCLLGMFPLMFGARMASEEGEDDMREITTRLDSIAGSLESKGLLKEATKVDIVSNTIEAQAAPPAQASRINKDMRQELKRLGLNVSMPLRNPGTGRVTQTVSFPNGLFMMIAMPEETDEQPVYQMTLLDESRRPMKLPMGRFFKSEPRHAAADPREIIKVSRMIGALSPEQLQRARSIGPMERMRGRERKQLTKHFTEGVEASMVEFLEYLADGLEDAGFMKEAADLDVISNTIEQPGINADPKSVIQTIKSMGSKSEVAQFLKGILQKAPGKFNQLVEAIWEMTKDVPISGIGRAAT